MRSNEPRVSVSSKKSATWNMALSEDMWIESRYSMAFWVPLNEVADAEFPMMGDSDLDEEFRPVYHANLSVLCIR